jgi:hypothetical protein
VENLEKKIEKRKRKKGGRRVKVTNGLLARSELNMVRAAWDVG